MQTRAKHPANRKRPAQKAARRAPLTTPRRPKRAKPTRERPPLPLGNLDQHQAAAALGISTALLRKWQREGRLAPVYMGRKPTYPRDLVERIAHEGPPPKPPDPQAAERAATVQTIMERLGGSER